MNNALKADNMLTKDFIRNGLKFRIEESFKGFPYILSDMLEFVQITEKEAAKKTGIKVEDIHAYVTGTKMPEIAELIKLSNLFNCSIEFLLGMAELQDMTVYSNKSFFENFDTLLKERKMELKSFYEESFIDNKSYEAWQKGEMPSVLNLIKIALLFDISVDCLIGNMHWEKV